MTNLQNPNIPAPIRAIEIDKAIYDLQLTLDTRLNWLSHNYGRAYRHVEKGKLYLYFPEVYIGGEKRGYYRVTPDNMKSGSCFFVVGREENTFEQNQYNFLKWNVGIVFNVNLDLIDKTATNNELITQNLIRDVRDVLTRHLSGTGFKLVIRDVVREFKQIYQEFNVREELEYLRAPMQAFRFNCEIELRENCEELTYDVCQALNNNLSLDEKICILQGLNFANEKVVNSLTEQQKNDLRLWLNS